MFWTGCCGQRTGCLIFPVVFAVWASVDRCLLAHTINVNNLLRSIMVVFIPRKFPGGRGHKGRVAFTLTPVWRLHSDNFPGRFGSGFGFGIESRVIFYPCCRKNAKS